MSMINTINLAVMYYSRSIPTGLRSQPLAFALELFLWISPDDAESCSSLKGFHRRIYDSTQIFQLISPHTDVLAASPLVVLTSYFGECEFCNVIDMRLLLGFPVPRAYEHQIMRHHLDSTV